MNDTIESIIERKKVKDVMVNKDKVFVLSGEDKLQKALEILSEHKILSAPVFDEVTKECLGLIDMFDLVSYMLSVYKESKTLQLVDGTSIEWQSWCHDVLKLEHKGQKIANTLIKNLIDVSTMNPYYTISKEASLPELIFLFKKGIHRAVVTDNNNLPCGIVSQSNVVKLLAEHVENYGRMGKTTVDDIGLACVPVVSINEDAQAIHGFFQMDVNSVSAVAICNHQGSLVGTLSVSDLRGINPSTLTDLLLPVLQYLHEKSPNTKFPPITCTPTTTFETVILKLASTGVHRLWKVDDFNRPLGVISLTDVMKLIDLRIYEDQSQQILINEGN